MVRLYGRYVNADSKVVEGERLAMCNLSRRTECSRFVKTRECTLVEKVGWDACVESDKDGCYY